MTPEEMKTYYITAYSDLQKIKKANGDYKNEELDYQIKVMAAKLASLSVNVEDLSL